MKLVFLFLLFSLCCSAKSALSQVYYITPNEGNCTTPNGTELTPCLTIQKVKNILPSLKNGSLTLLFLSGRHFILYQTLEIDSFTDVDIHPLSGEERVEIQGGAIIFKDVVRLKVTSLYFQGCSLNFTEGDRDLKNMTFSITKCYFKSTNDYPALQSIVTRLDITISNCNFFSNRRALYINDSSSIEERHSVYITNTLFQGNEGGTISIEGKKVTLENCQFINNYNGIIYVHSSSLLLNNATFQGNGLNSIFVNSSSANISNCQFMNNTGIIYFEGGEQGSFISDSTFTGNSADTNIAFIYIGSTKVTITHCLFEENSGGAVFINNGTCEINNSSLHHNTAGSHGGAVKIHKGTCEINNSSLHHNTAVSVGGAVYIYNGRCEINNSSLHHNTAGLYGGAVYVYIGKGRCEINNSSLHYNRAGSDGGAVYIGKGRCEINNSSLVNNTAAQRGGAVYCESLGEVHLSGGYSSSNSASKGGFAHLKYCSMIWERYDYTISNNTATSNGGAIYAEGTSQIKFNSTVTLTGNIAEGNGGAMFINNSHASIGGREVTDKVFVTFSSNEARKEGGAIYVLDNDCSRKPPDQNPCFFNVQYNNKKYLHFVNNTAADGPVLYGGMLDRCMVDTLPSPELGIKVIKNISEYEDTPFAITSDPIICLCIDNKPDCSTREKAYTRMSGQAIHLVGTAVDQDNNQKASMITARYTQLSAQLAAQESSAEFGPVCQDLIYHIKTDNSSARLLLQATGRCEITINFEVKCAVGFQVDKDGCNCDERLIKLFGTSVNCDFDSGNFTQEGRKGSTWIQYHGDKLKVNTHCPLGYCQDKSDIIDQKHPDDQCANNRGGILCGGCRENFTLALGGSKCIECSSRYALLWMIPVCVLAGIALVALLLVCNMTVSHGTLNGLIFYANIVSITGLTNLQNCYIHPILSIFIAWINLDFGIETCFYPGMDSYYKTLLQFAFPLYIVLLVGVIALVSHYSTTAVKVFGRNNIAILTTLFLLSYTKILKTIFTALDITQVYKGSANEGNLVPYNVWTYDGNVEYLKGKHIPLFGVAIMAFIFLFLPYTLLLMFGQCIRSLPTERRCVLKFTTSTGFISIMDAYHAPYHPRHRYWTGLMLLVRCAIFLAFFFSFRGSELVANMFITTLILISIFTLKVFFKKIYKNFLLNILELAFLLNLLCLSVTVLYLKNDNNIMNSDICTFTSVSISVSLTMFTGILSYHSYLQLNKTRCFTSIKRELAKINLTRLYRKIPDDDDYYPPPPPPPPQKVGVQKLPTTTTIGLDEEELKNPTY